YRLALDMGSAATYQELVEVVLGGLLEATAAEVGAILSVPRPEGSEAPSPERPSRGQELEVTAYRHRDPGAKGYVRVSEFVSNEVLASKEAILAEDVARDRFLRIRESLSDLGATSLICAPILFNERLLGLIHLYCTDPHRALDTEDLEFAVAVAR